MIVMNDRNFGEVSGAHVRIIRSPPQAGGWRVRGMGGEGRGQARLTDSQLSCMARPPF